MALPKPHPARFAAVDLTPDAGILFILLILSKNYILPRNILDTKGPDTRFYQCLQGFRVFKKAVIMTCTKTALCAIMGARKAES
jgi:hypothetical protein